MQIIPKLQSVLYDCDYQELLDIACKRTLEESQSSSIIRDCLQYIEDKTITLFEALNIVLDNIDYHIVASFR